MQLNLLWQIINEQSEDCKDKKFSPDNTPDDLREKSIIELSLSQPILFISSDYLTLENEIGKQI